jgi:lysophospholipase L1-like esterase
MNPVGPFQTATSALPESGRAARPKSGSAPAGPFASNPFQETLAQVRPTGAQSGGQVRVQTGETLIGITRRVLQDQGQNPSEAEVHRVAMAVAKNNALANPNLIRTGQTLNFPNVTLARKSPELETPNPTRPPASGPITPTPTPALPAMAANKALAETAPAAPLATAPAKSGPKIAIVGDSIAVGIGGAVLKQSGITPEFAPGRKFLTQHQGSFAVNAVGGHSSPQILSQLNKDAGVKNADLAIISVGTNDFVNSPVNKYYTPERITQNLQRIRTELNAKDRVWVLPYDPKARELVQSVANERGDKTIDLGQFQPADRYHPRNYAAIASSISPLLNQIQSAQAAAPEAHQQAWVSTQNALLARGAKF